MATHCCLDWSKLCSHSSHEWLVFQDPGSAGQPYRNGPARWSRLRFWRAKIQHHPSQFKTKAWTAGSSGNCEGSRASCDTTWNCSKAYGRRKSNGSQSAQSRLLCPLFYQQRKSKSSLKVARRSLNARSVLQGTHGEGHAIDA
jgi:hypothetical protein